MRRLFPNIVTGVAVMLIGAGLTATGMKYWGGGLRVLKSTMEEQRTSLRLGWISIRDKRYSSWRCAVPGGTAGGKSTCDGNGDVIKAFGSPEYIAMGFSGRGHAHPR